MNGNVYKKLAKVLDTLPNGFPPTESGIEIRLLKKIFSPEEAELFCLLKLNFETPEHISERIGRTPAELAYRLEVMKSKGLVFGFEIKGINFYRMLPWAFGIYEMQMHRLDREMAEMCQQYEDAFSRQFFSNTPPLMQVIPVEKEILAHQQVMPYERVSHIIKKSRSIMYIDCICKKERGMIGEPCERSVQVCTVYAPIRGLFDNHPFGTVMTRQEAYELLDRAEAQGLVHLTCNVQNGHFFICNCCGCCCRVLRSINDMGFPTSEVLNTYYYAEIDSDACVACGICAKERCQTNAILQDGGAYRVNLEKCIGCGLCVSTCPEKAVSLIRKPEDQIKLPPEDEMQWYLARAKMRGIDISNFT